MKITKISPTIVDNQQEYIELLTAASLRVKREFYGLKPTEINALVNIFSLTSTSVLMHKLFNEIRTIVRDELGYEKPLWIQSWLNFQDKNNLLQWHDHDWDWHGYVCIDPKNTKTVWREYEIENKIGQIYFGSGHKEHTVEIVEPFVGNRITIGFDITDVGDYYSLNKGLIPF